MNGTITYLATAAPPAPAPSGTSALLTPIIAAAAALLGVFLGQVLQSRREQRNWDRQATEQRRRDAEQREDQRERDRLAWEREDKDRFKSDKRIIYARALATLEDIRSSIDELIIYKQTEGEWAKSIANSTTDHIQSSMKDARTVIEEVRLIAPHEIGRSLSAWRSMLTVVHTRVLQREYQVATTKMEEEDIYYLPLRRAMRVDLGTADAMEKNL